MTAAGAARLLREAGRIAFIAALAAGDARAAQSQGPLPRSALAVETASGWVTWWRSDGAPTQWLHADSVVAAALAWRRAADGVELTELRLAGSGEAWRLRAIVVRVDPTQTRMRLVARATRDGARPAWTIDSAGGRALVAFNAGQFTGASPWGWVVADGVERYSPQRGALAAAVGVDSSGALLWVDSSGARRPLLRGAVQGFQSYPALLVADGRVPAALRAPGGGVDVVHRDARLAIGRLADGRLLVVLTRFDALGGALGEVPFGLTTPELAALMGALGARQAVALDGGISAQLLVRDGDVVRAWRGMRRVPLGLVIEGR